jgi:hypothetical protein
MPERVKSEITDTGFISKPFHNLFPVAKRPFNEATIFSAPVAMPKNPRFIWISVFVTLSENLI